MLSSTGYVSQFLRFYTRCLW